MEFNSIDQVLQESKGGPYIYEVRCFVHLAVERKWRQYMDENHIPDVLKTGFFISAKILKLHKHFDEETIDPSMWQAYFVQYRLEGVDKLEE